MLKNRTPAFIVLLALCWAFIADPLITLLAAYLAPHHADLFRRVNDVLLILVVTAALYRPLQRAAGQYRRLYHDIPTPMYVYDRQTLQFLAVNDAAVKRYGYSYRQFLRMKASDIRPPEETDRLLEVIAGLSAGYSDAGRWQHITAAGEVFYVRIFAQPTLFKNRRAVQIVAIDIDKKIKTERALAEKTAELENVLESITDAFYTVDKDWRFTYVNSEYERVQKRNRKDLLGKNIWAEFPYAAELAFYQQYHWAMAEQVSVHFEEYNPARDMWVTANAYPTASGLAIYFRDITAEKKIREKVYLDGQNLRAIINNTSDLIWSVDQQFNIITGNEAFWKRVAELTGKSEATITNADFDPQLLEGYIAHYQVAFAGKAFRVVRERQDAEGMAIFEQLSFNPICDQQTVIGVNCYLRDITEQHQHLRKIEKQNQCLTEIAWLQSHSVRAPLANILGLVPLFEPDDPENKAVLEKIRLAAAELDEVIREITAYANQA
ncbi:hypothetical protein BEL04_17500 [Mucilaginibacter sp. PPCGB 2223]|uniref:PAS domain-containing protein n=1 Tax=Mucilaginibacter sp. PPCGB 2223 TaxID=1886027 RepID=UPI000824CD1B|nr:PAS domain S-box protein [Mucilaginibacter sp. PPCGB 2223]OCX51807.1 hypothetical protein BEL04_17500 [Mucilaginibacter sp. PPCGB 2223]